MTSAQDHSARDAGGGTQAGAPASTSSAAPAGAPSGAAQETAARQYVPRPAPHYDDASAAAEPSGAVRGFTIYAAVMMMLSGGWDFLVGLAAIIRGSFFVVLPRYAFDMSVTGWGWFHLILGVAVFLAGAALLTDQFWARVVGVGLAAVSAVVNFLYIPYLPVWSIVVIALDIAVIWALLTPRRAYT